MLIAPWAPTFLDRYPEVSLELGISDRFVDIIRERFDIAIRMGSLTDSDLVSRRIGDIRFVLAASPDYIARNSVPADVNDLGRHVFVRYVASGRPWPCILADETQLPTSGRFVTDDSGSIREAVIRGAGIAYLLHVTVAQDLAEGRLVELLPDLRLPTMPVSAVHISEGVGVPPGLVTACRSPAGCCFGRIASLKPGLGALMRHRRTTNDRMQESSVGSRMAIVGAIRTDAAARLCPSNGRDGTYLFTVEGRR